MGYFKTQMQIPEKLGKYEIEQQIGCGSMGIVYKGHDPFSDRDVAVKVALSESLQDKESGERYRKMFFNEAHTAGTLKHPNIVGILDAGVDDGHCYIVMELVEGAETLKPYCRSKNLLPFESVIEIIFKCAKALDYAHRNGVIHRDIKPTNILLTKDRDVKIADFSIARMVNADTSGTMLTGFVGSPRYMSPEQAREETVTNQTDLFSLGIVMYELLTGKHPFMANSFSSLIHDIINGKHPPLSKYRSDIPSILEKIVHHALRKNPVQRYKMGLNFAADLSLAFDHLEKPREDMETKERFDTIQSLLFFREFSESEIWEIIRACVLQEFETGSEIIVEGDIDHSFYIIISGEVDVYKDGALIGNLKTGDCFGEMSYLGKTRRTATIIAKQHVQLMKINATLIEQTSVECQLRFSRVFIQTLVKRLSETTAMYASLQDK